MTTPNNTVAGLPAKWRAEAEVLDKSFSPGSAIIAAERRARADELEAALASPAVGVDAKNAARYRFLRQPGNAIVYAMHPEAWGMCSPPRSGHVRYETPEQLDAAIDEAMFAALAGKDGA